MRSFMQSASALGNIVHEVCERERERETEEASPLSRWNWRWVYTFPIAKNWLACFVSPFALFVSPFSNSHHRGAEIRNEFTFSVAKKKRSLCCDSLKRHEWLRTQDQWWNMCLPRPRLLFPSKKWIKIIPKTIGNRKRDCTRGCSGW